MVGYVRQSAADIQAGLVVKSDIFNKEFNALASAFSIGGHTHDGTTGNGPKIDIVQGTTGVLPEARMNLSNFVKGAANSDPDHIAVYNGTSGKVIKNGGYTVSQVLNRDFHTGNQPISSVSNLQSSLDGKLNLSGGRMTGVLEIEQPTRHIRLYGPNDKLIEFYDSDNNKSGGIYQASASKSFVISPWDIPGTSASATFFSFRPDGDLVLPNNTPINDRAAASKKFVNDGLAGKINTGDADKTTLATVTSAMSSAPLEGVDETNDRLFLLVNGAPSKRMGWSTVRTWIKSWIAKSDVGLSNVDNTSDANKPISTATQNALNAKFDKSGGTITNNVTLSKSGAPLTLNNLAARSNTAAGSSNTGGFLSSQIGVDIIASFYAFEQVGSHTQATIALSPGGGSPNTFLTFRGNGSLQVPGALSKGSGTFLIDHPLDPLNKNLRHGFVEAPEYLNIYRGTVDLEGGRMAVDIDAAFGMTDGTFAALNVEVCVFVQTQYGPEKVWVEAPADSGKFVICSENPESTATVAFMVTGRRNDAFVRSDLDPNTDSEGRFIPEYEKEA